MTRLVADGARQPDERKVELIGAGFARVEVIERDPYLDVEYPSRRAYVFASKPELGAVSEPAEPVAAADGGGL